MNGVLFIGFSLIPGLMVRWSAMLGILLMVLYWFPVLDFPYAGHSFIIDDHIVYALLFVLMLTINAGQYFGLDKLCNKNQENGERNRLSG